ncbi:hypothetical protein ZWY2020_016785 [Hordeum vulgare]|nr:hypothetical protein ZWY2020_016785 [Hordeum vulgare]
MLMAKKPVRGVRGRAWGDTGRRTGARAGYVHAVITSAIAFSCCECACVRAGLLLLPTETGRGRGGETATARSNLLSRHAAGRLPGQVHQICSVRIFSNLPDLLFYSVVLEANQINVSFSEKKQRMHAVNHKAAE